MDDPKTEPRTIAWLTEQNEDLCRRLEETEQTLEAIRHGDVDALVMTGPKGEQVYSLGGAEHVYRTIVETMHEAALTVDLDGTILFCNRRFCDLMKTPIHKVMGLKMTAFVARPQQPYFEALLTSARTGPVQQRLTLRAADGTIVPMQLSASPLWTGDSLSICLAASDLTELEESATSVQALRQREQAMQEANERLQVQSEEFQAQAEELRVQTEELRTTEAMLRESEQRLALALSGTGVGMYNRDLATDEVLCTEPVARFLGLRPTTTTTTTTTLSPGYHYEEWARCVHREDLPRVEAELKRCTADGLPYEQEYRVVWPDRSVHWVADRAVFQCEDQGRRIHMLGVMMDITERKRAEEALREWNATLETRVGERTAELQQRARQLQRLTLEISETEDRERRRMAEILHDDLQQQLAAAKFHLGLLRSRARHDVSMLEVADEIDHMLKVAIEKSRSLSHELSPAVMHHGDFGETVQWLAGEVRAKHGLVVHVEAHGEVCSESEVIKGFLYKAAQEFLFNVVKHARVNEARIRIRRFGRYLCLSVSDRGRGFDPQGLREAAGFGLLSIRERVELLGGRMKIRSAIDKGSTFSIAVPDDQVHEAPSQAATRLDGQATTAESAAHEDRGRIRVLLADDHEIVRHGLRSLLGDEHDVEVVGEAANGREAVDLASQLKPDLVIMDVSMPMIEGNDATRQIKTCLPKTRVIALSMYDQHEKIEAMYKAGAERYVLKTVPSEELLAAIRGGN
jgi:PAS domain S-box-containing protein